MSEKETYEQPIIHKGPVEQNEGLLNLMKDSYYNFYPENTAQWILGEVARQIGDGEYISCKDWRVDYLLDPNLKRKSFNSKEKMYFLLMQEEVAKYVFKNSLSADSEGEDRYRYFFGLPTKWQEFEDSQNPSDRVFFATKILDFLTRQGIDNSELKKKLFDEIYIDYGLEKIYNIESITEYVRETSRIVRHFTLSEYLEIEEYRKVVKNYVHKTLKHLYKTRNIDELTFKDDLIHNDLESLLYREWLWDEETQNLFIEDEELQDRLIKVDIEIKRGNLSEEYVESSLDVIKDNINGLSTRIFERRFENIKISIEDILVSLKELENSKSKDDYQLLFEKYQRLSEWYCDEYSYVLEEVLCEITGLGGDYNRKAMLPELKKLFVRIEWGNSIENVLRSYNNFKYLLDLNGGLTS
jgi:hypothetical protein